MKTAHVAPLAVSVRLGLYGGTERVVATVYHGLPPDVCPSNAPPHAACLAFLGPGDAPKGLERAVPRGGSISIA